MVRGLARRRPSHIVSVAVVILLFVVLQRTFSSGSHEPSPPKYHEPLHFKASSEDWAGARLFFPPESMIPLPTGQPKALPQVQAAFDTFRDTQVTRDRREAVKKVFLRSWNAYKEQAWTWDELRPVTGGGKNTFGGWAATLVDSLDTLWMRAFMTNSTKLDRLRLSLTGRTPRRLPPIFSRPPSDISVASSAHMI